jgi:RNA polymerase sigma factor (TIGR02999 family)
MDDSTKKPVTQLLLEWRGGSEEALDRLMPLIYDEQRVLAKRYLRSERSDHTLQGTALVNEAYMRLVDMDVSWTDRAHFFAVAARLMRRMLVDHARSWPPASARRPSRCRLSSSICSRSRIPARPVGTR